MKLNWIVCAAVGIGLAGCGIKTTPYKYTPPPMPKFEPPVFKPSDTNYDEFLKNVLRCKEAKPVVFLLRGPIYPVSVLKGEAKIEIADAPIWKDGAGGKRIYNFGCTEEFVKAESEGLTLAQAEEKTPLVFADKVLLCGKLEPGKLPSLNAKQIVMKDLDYDAYGNLFIVTAEVLTLEGMNKLKVTARSGPFRAADDSVTIQVDRPVEGAGHLELSSELKTCAQYESESK